MRLLQVLPGVIRRRNGELEVDTDFVEALRVYLEQFDAVTVACPIAENSSSSGVVNCRPVKELPWRSGEVTFLPLPAAYKPLDFSRQYFAVRRILRHQLEQADYVVVSPHTLIGDWPMVAAREAIKMRRRYVLEADVVYGILSELELKQKGSLRRAVKRFFLFLFRHSYRYCLRHSSVSFFQGGDVYDAYAKFCRNPHNILYHVPVYADTYITKDELKKKVGHLDARPLRICYAGRAIEMKSPKDWVNTVDALVKSGVQLTATWFGDGPLLESLRSDIIARGLSACVEFRGFENQETVFQAIRESDIFLFCHKTMESARVLGEALALGCPLVGYGGSYPSDLIACHGGGWFAPVGCWGELVEYVQRLDRNRKELQDIICRAAKSGRELDRDAAMRRKIALLKQFA